MIIHKKKYRFPISLLLFGTVFCIVSAIVSVDSTEEWFMRSGAVLSFVSVAVQLILSNLKRNEIEDLFNRDVGLKEKFKIVKEKDVRHDFVSTVSAVTGLVGTIIWGYGDLFY